MPKIFPTILLLLFSIFLEAQSTQKPKVGLVLSGGSAHGLSHIGVLKYLEEKGIRVDYITGTSMGSIIGGLYAMGMTAKEIEKIAAEEDWGALLSTDIPLRQVAPSEKFHHSRYPIKLEYNEDGLQLPLGFFNSQNLDLSLNRIFRAAHNIRDFDSLPYPYKCITVDIENGDVIELDKGFLGHAVRASMAIPSVFTPVSIDGRLLVDGGLIRNFPVEEVVKMGADIVIGVYVGSKLEKKDKLNSLVDILNQSAFMMGILDSKKQKKLTTVLIEPDVKDLPNFGFDLYEELIQEGYYAAKGQAEKIDSVSKVLSNFKTRETKKLRTPEAVDLSDTRFPYIQAPFDALARFKYGINQSGSTSFKRIENGISRIFGTKHFENINYTFHRDGRGRKIIDILAAPRELKALSFGLNFMPSTATSFVITNELRNILNKPSVLFTTLRVAENYGARLDYKYRMGKKKDFLFSISGLTHKYEQELFEDEIIRERFSEIIAAAKIGVGFEPNNVLITNAYLKVENVILDPREKRDADFQRYSRLDIISGIDVGMNSLDELQFPTSGVDLTADVSYHLKAKSEIENNQNGNLRIPEDESYIGAQVKVDGYYPLTKSLVLSGHVNAGYKTSESLTNNYRVGGLEDRDLYSISMIGLNTHQFHYRKYFQAGSTIRLQLGASIYVALRSDFIQGTRTFVLKDTDTSILESSFWSGGIIASLRTPVGPLHVSYGRNGLSDQWNTNFTFGYAFF